MAPFWQIIAPLLLTIGIEGCIFALLTRSFSGQGALLACNLITNPLLNLALVLAGSALYMPVFVVGECLVFVLEGILLSCLLRKSKKSAFLLSFCVNAASLLFGMLLF